MNFQSWLKTFFFFIFFHFAKIICVNATKKLKKNHRFQEKIQPVNGMLSMIGKFDRAHNLMIIIVWREREKEEEE